MTLRILSLVLFASSFVAACNGCDEPVAPVKDDDGSLPVGGEKERHVLTYVGDDPLELHYGEEASLRFTWKTESGLPAAGEPITVQLNGTAITIDGGSTFATDTGGAIEVPVNAGLADGEATVVARASDSDGTVKEDSVLVRVRENPAGGLRVTVESDARIPVTSATARILAGTNPPTCESLLGGSPAPSAQYTATFAPIPSTQSFTNLPAHSKAVVLVDGLNAQGVIVARGCNAAGPLPGGVETPVVVTLEQDETTVTGDYDVLQHMALGDALPHPYDDTVELITALLADPAGYATYVVLREIDNQTGFTTFTYDADGITQLSYREMEEDVLANPNSHPTWFLARDRLDQLLEDQLGQTYVDVTNVGAGIRDVVTDFEVGARFNVHDGGTPGVLSIDETWNAMVLYWPLPCADGDLACARRALSLEDMNLAPVTTSYGASYAYEAADGHIERFEVTTDPHGLNVRYGAFLLAILNQVVFPSLPGSVAGNSFGDVLSNLVGCDNIASSLFDDPAASIFVEGICEAGLSIAANEIEQRLIDLQIDATNPELGEEGLAAGGSFALYDDDADLTTEIVDEYVFNVAWNNPTDPNATADISAPIRGDGLRTREACTDDATCDAGFACAPRGSYLKVAQVELGCERTNGALAGGAVCVGDAQCASGLCAPVGVGGALQCFRACDAINDCAAGQLCSDVGGSVNLDDVIDGLGDVAVRGCAAP
jgi:hypothetical protein